MSAHTFLIGNLIKSSLKLPWLGSIAKTNGRSLEKLIQLGEKEFSNTDLEYYIAFYTTDNAYTKYEKEGEFAIYCALIYNPSIKKKKSKELMIKLVKDAISQLKEAGIEAGWSGRSEDPIFISNQCEYESISFEKGTRKLSALFKESYADYLSSNGVERPIIELYLAALQKFSDQGIDPFFSENIFHKCAEQYKLDNRFQLSADMLSDLINKS